MTSRFQTTVCFASAQVSPLCSTTAKIIALYHCILTLMFLTTPDVIRASGVLIYACLCVSLITIACVGYHSAQVTKVMMMMMMMMIVIITRKDVLTTSVNSRRPSVHKLLVTPLFGNGFSR